MADIHDKVEQHYTAAEKVINAIPGWSGYQKRQKRRQADKLLRQTLADRLEAQRRRLNTAQKELLERSRLDLLDDLESAATQLKTFADRVRFASYGYAGLFDAVKINESELKQLYDFDAALIDYVERLDTANGHLRDAIAQGEGVEDTIEVIQEITREANDTFDRRQRLILETE
jgi:type II secretory pathway pseudopilin PulG